MIGNGSTGLLVEQFGVVSRAQALECGVSRGRLDHLVRPGGRWQRILPGVYVMNTGAVSVDQRAMAALLYAGPKSLLTGAAAVRRHRLQCAGLNQVDVLVPEDVRVRSAGYVRIVRTGRMPDKCFRTRRIRYVPLARAVADAARPMTSLGDVRALVAEAIQNGRCDVASLVAELNDGPVAGSRFYRVALRECIAGSRSAAEGDLMTLIGRSDLPEPMYNAELYTADGTFLGIADVWWQRGGRRRRGRLAPLPPESRRLRAHGDAAQPDGGPRHQRPALPARHREERAVDRHQEPARRDQNRQRPAARSSSWPSRPPPPPASRGVTPST